MNMDKVKIYAEKFMEKEYRDEAPYFHIAWDIFKEICETENIDLDLKGPVVRFEGEDTIMAPTVIRAFYTLFSEAGDKIKTLEDAALESLIMEVLSRNKFSSEFSRKIADFVLEAV